MIILTEREIAERLGVSYWTVRSWRLQLDIPYFRTAGRIFYRLSSVEKWMDRQEEKTVSNKINRILPIAQ